MTDPPSLRTAARGLEDGNLVAAWIPPAKPDPTAGADGDIDKLSRLRGCIPEKLWAGRTNSQALWVAVHMAAGYGLWANLYMKSRREGLAHPMTLPSLLGIPFLCSEDTRQCPALVKVRIWLKLSDRRIL